MKSSQSNGKRKNYNKWSLFLFLIQSLWVGCEGRAVINEASQLSSDGDGSMLVHQQPTAEGVKLVGLDTIDIVDVDMNNHYRIVITQHPDSDYCMFEMYITEDSTLKSLCKNDSIILNTGGMISNSSYSSIEVENNSLKINLLFGGQNYRTALEIEFANHDGVFLFESITGNEAYLDEIDDKGNIMENKITIKRALGQKVFICDFSFNDYMDKFNL